MDFYRDMYDQQIATDLAEKEVLGVSQLINRQLGLGEADTNSVDNEVVAEAKNAIAESNDLESLINKSKNEISEAGATSVQQSIVPPQVATIFEKKSSLDGLSEIRLQPIETAQDDSATICFQARIAAGFC